VGGEKKEKKRKEKKRHPCPLKSMKIGVSLELQEDHCPNRYFVGKGKETENGTKRIIYYSSPQLGRIESKCG
jgi:hypothetical protein